MAFTPPRILILLAACSLLALAASPGAAAQLEVKFGATVISENSTFDFGSTLVGEDLALVLTVKNVGSSAVTLGPYSVGYNANDPSHFSTGATNVPSPLAPGASGTVELIYHADAEGTVTNSFRIFEGGTPEWEFFPTATTTTPVGPILRVKLGNNTITHGELVDFGNTGVGIPVTRIFTAYNIGDQPLTIGTISIGSQVGDPASFDVGFNHAVNIQPGGNKGFRLDFAAAALGSVTSQIRLFVGGISRKEFFVKGTVLPPDFEVSIEPPLQTVPVEQSTSYTVSLTGLYGFTGTVPLSISDLPTGTNRVFTPVNVPVGGTSQLEISTDASTPTVNEATFTVTGTSGSLTHSATAQITITPPADFVLSISPSLRTISPGDSTTYRVTLDPIDGFNHSVALSSPELPEGATASFDPPSLVPPGISTLTIDTSPSMPLGDELISATGIGGGQAHRRRSTLRLISSTTGEPAVDSITPDSFNGGQVKSVSIDGENLQGATVSVATTPVDPGDPTPAAYPGVNLVSINGAGTHMVVEIDATDPDVSGFYNLVVETAGGQAGAPFRVLTDGPEVDVWTPREPARGQTYSLTMLGVNLNGATVSVSGGGGVDAFVVASSSGELNGFLYVSSTASLGNRTLVVRRGSRQTQLPITVVADTASSNLQTLNVTEEAAKKAALVGEKVPTVLFQEFSVSDKLAWSSDSGGETLGSCSVSLGWQVYRYVYILALPFDPGSGRILFDILRNMNIGVPVPFGVRIFSAFADLNLTVRFNCSPISQVQICLIGNIGFEIPGIGGQIWSAGGCIFGGLFFPVLTTTGNIGNFTFRNDGQCTDVVPTTPPTIGEQQALVTMNSCCTEDLRIDTTGQSFNGTIYAVGFSVANHAVAGGLMSGNSQECGCQCSVTLDFPDIKPGETKSLAAKLRNVGQAQCSYNWNIAKSGDQGATPTFSPSSGAITLPPSQEQDLGINITLPSGTQDGRSPTLELSAMNTNGTGGCQVESQVCVIPTGEISAFVEWDTPSGDLAHFQGILSPGIAWTGEEVTEDPPGSGTGSYDTCWFEGSSIRKYTDEHSITGGSWPLTGDLYGYDSIGNDGDVDFFYFLSETTPCVKGTVQHMKRKCPAAGGETRLVEYKANEFRWTVSHTSTTICRDNACSTPH